MNVNTSLRGMLIMCLVFLSSWVMAQNKTVSGKVTDAKDGSPIAGASVVAKGTKTGTQTGADGSFKLSVPATAKTLTISFTGYVAQDVAISDNISVSLTQSIENLTDVVVQIGYGGSRKKDLTGSVVSLQAKDFNQGVITAPDQLLQNKVAGLEVTSQNGQPGAATTVKIRGNNSIRAGGNPLYVIDGVPLDGRSARPVFSGGAVNGSPDANPLLFINPNDIQSIDVLKDASAAAIYGSRGANGVVVITTKTGSSGPAKLEFSSSWGANAGLLKRYNILKTGEFRDALKKYGITGQDNGSDVDAFKSIKNTNLSQNYSLALSGGGENGKFRASFLASSANGFIKNSTLDKYVGTFSGETKFMDKRLTLGFNLIAGHTTESLVGVSNLAGSEGNIISSALQWNPTTAMTTANGTFVYPTNGSGNPMAILAAINDKAYVNSILGNVRGSYKILDNLEYKFLYAINNSVGNRFVNQYGFIQGFNSISGKGLGAILNTQLTSETFTHTLSYKTNLTKKIKLDAVAGYEYWKSNFKANAFSATGFNTNLDQFNVTIPYTNMLANGTSQALPFSYADPKVELQSYFARAQFNYDDRYYLTVTVRADGSSKFGKNNKYGYFPSIAARWAISNEKFMQSNKLFSNLSLRASYGITGNQEFPAGASQEQFVFSSYNNASQVNVANPDLKWEQTGSYDVGVDFTSKNGKVFGSIDVYSKNTTNILFQSTAIQPAPNSIYFLNLPAKDRKSVV